MTSVVIMKGGVPYDVAHAMEEHELLAHWVMVGLVESGREFDWDRMRFIERK